MKRIAFAAAAAVLAVIGVQSTAIAAPPAKGSSEALVSTLESLRYPVQEAEYKANLQTGTNDYSMRQVGHSDNDDYSYLGAAYKTAYAEGKTACDAWVVGKTANVKVAAKVYCSVWKSTLRANAIANGGSEFDTSAAGAQYIRAKAEFEAVAGG